MAAVTHTLLALAVATSLAIASCADHPACAPCGPTPSCASASNAVQGPPSAQPVATTAAPLALEAPHPSSSADAEPSLALQVMITRDGQLFVDGARVAAVEQVAELARSAKVRDAELRVIVAADQSATHGSVMAVVDALKSAGVARIAFAVAAPPTTAPGAAPRTAPE